MKKIIYILGLTILFGSFISCTSNTESNTKTKNQTGENKVQSDPLPSWNDGTTKEAIISYVEDVTNTESKNFIAIPDRIATFDNDGLDVSLMKIS